jgi:hypothetical protein
MAFIKSPHLFFWIGAFFYSFANADEPNYAFKLSPSYYMSSNGVHASDINFRVTRDSTNLWGGYTKEYDGLVSQYRWGADNRKSISDSTYLLSSLQNASGGLWAGTAGLEYGNSWFVNGILGRTNLQPYWNLNFDPNDSYQIGFGKRISKGDSFYLSHIHDNRLNPNQSNSHFVYRNRLNSGDYISYDLLYKQGLVDGEMIRKFGAAIEYDHKHYFAKIAFDPKVNFTANNMTRITLGLKF